MRYFLFLLVTLIIIISNDVEAQKAKSLKIYSDRNNKFHVNGIVHYDKENAIIDTLYYLSVMDDRYTTIYQGLTLTTGTLQEVYDFIAEVYKTTCTEEIDATVTIKGCRVHICKILGSRSAMIYESDRVGGVGTVSTTKLQGGMYGIEKYCRKYSIAINRSEVKLSTNN